MINPLFWIARRGDGCILDIRGRWMKQCAGVEDIKTWKREHNLWKNKEVHRQWISDGADTSAMTAFAVNEGDTLDICGRIIRSHGRVD